MISNMSEDLVIEILCRLPVKHIIQCKCVCKAWCTLVATSRFIDFHLNQATMRTPNLLLVSSFHKNFYSLDCERCDEAVHLHFDLSPLTGISIVGSCNGLFCLSDYKSFVSLWNPSTGEYVKLVCDGLVHSQRNSGDDFYESERSTVAMGIGYDAVTEEYKIVRLEYFFDVLRCGIMTEFDRCEVKVYALGTNSWRRLVDDTPSPPWYIGNLSRVAHVNGVLHWIGIRGIGIELSKSIISFDLRNEKFGEISWPEFVDHNYRDLGLGVLQGCLCTFSYHLEHVDVWAMTEYGGSNWTRKFSIARSTRYLEPLVLRKNGEILLQRGHRNLILYDPVTEAFKVPTISGTPDWFRTSTYVESLITIASLIGTSGH